VRFHRASEGVALQRLSGDRFVCNAQFPKGELVAEKSIRIRLVEIVLARRRRSFVVARSRC